MKQLNCTTKLTFLCTMASSSFTHNEPSVASHTIPTLNVLFRKSLSKALFLYLVIKEAQDRGEMQSIYFGPKIENGIVISLAQSVTRYMELTDTRRSSEVYEHEHCSDGCR